jgi:hypothetical protein
VCSSWQIRAVMEKRSVGGKSARNASNRKRHGRSAAREMLLYR